MTEILTWLYTSEFTSPKTPAYIDKLVGGFASKNEEIGLTGFMITNGVAVMQLLEGERENITAVRRSITEDSRHTNIHPEVSDVSPVRAYPNWAMRSIALDDYEVLFSEIERAKIHTIAIKIASMLFDVTFQSKS
ncbi:MAG: BLUF domain-containing protein [Litorimonas sp.]